MIRYSTIENFYFLGIGGIGMSAIARYVKNSGRNVAGYDLTSSVLTRKLEEEGMKIHYKEAIELIPSGFQPENTIVVYTPAVPTSHSEYLYFLDEGYSVLKRSEVLGVLTNDIDCIAVAGTHGKTSVSTMTTNALHQSGIEAGAFLGGISRNFESNLVLPGNDCNYVVVEADEFDRSFLRLNPSMAVITSIDADHLDIYETYDAVKEAFGEFIQKIKKGGTLIIKKGLDVDEYSADLKVYTYSIVEKADFYAANITIVNEHYTLDLVTPNSIIFNIVFYYPGRVNIENMVAASAVAQLIGANEDGIRNAFATYKGVQRRFDIRYRDENVIFIDDYAHHPVELKATISSVKELYKGKKVLGVFQPHLFTRTRDFAADFAKSLDLLDEIIVLEIYPAREKPIEGVTSNLIIEQIVNKKCHFVTKNEVVSYLSNLKFDVLLTMGAGDIDRLENELIEMIKNKKLHEA